MPASIDLVPLFTQELDLCRVGPGETVAVLEDAASPAGYADAFMAAAEALGARAFAVRLPKPVRGGGSGLHKAYGVGLPGLDAAVTALKQSDLVVDLVRLLFSPEQHEILKGKTRMLLVSEPPEVLARLLPSEDLRERVEAAERMLAAAELLEISSDAGTKMTFPLGQYPVLAEYGYTDTPGRWDHWPSGFVCTWPNEEAAAGTIVLAPGDIIFPFKTYVRSPVHITVEAGFITHIAGDLDAEYLSEYLASWRDPDAYALSHIGFGVNDRAQWTALGMLGLASTGMDGRSFAGNVLFSTGPNTEVGGDRTTAAHLDIPMRQTTLDLDGRTIVDRGRLVMPQLCIDPPDLARPSHSPA